MKLWSGLLAGLMLTVAVPVSAQSLGELAKREQERRKSTPRATKTYTNEDLKKVAIPPPAPSDPSAKPEQKTTPKEGSKAEDRPNAADDPSKPADPAKPADSAKDEGYWRGRITQVREGLRRDEMFREALQVRINALSADFAARDDPYQRATIADDRQKALAELTRVTTEIEQFTKQIADIEEEARRAGVPPGWLR
jgi:hypothetical protein